MELRAIIVTLLTKFHEILTCLRHLELSILKIALFKQSHVADQVTMKFQVNLSHVCNQPDISLFLDSLIAQDIFINNSRDVFSHWFHHGACETGRYFSCGVVSLK